MRPYLMVILKHSEASGVEKFKKKTSKGREQVDKTVTAPARNWTSVSGLGGQSQIPIPIHLNSLRKREDRFFTISLLTILDILVHQQCQ